MFRWFLVCVLLCGGTYFAIKYIAPPIQSRAGGQDTPSTTEAASGYAPITFPTHGAKGDSESNPLIIPGAHITLGEKEEVGSDRDGQILFFGTPLKPGEESSVPADHIIEQRFVYLALEVAYDPLKPAHAYPLAETPRTNGTEQDKPAKFMVPFLVDGKNNYFYLDNNSDTVYTRWKVGMPIFAKHVRIVEEIRKFRKLEELDPVEVKQTIALINPELAITELRSKHNKLNEQEADRIASEKTRDETKLRYQRVVDSHGSPQEIGEALLQWKRYEQEEIAKQSVVATGQFDVIAAMNVVNLHEVKAMIPGIVKVIYKNRGDSVKSYQEALLQIVNPASLRAEAMAEVQDVERLHKGQEVFLEVSSRVTPRYTLTGAHQEINAVVVSRGLSSKDPNSKRGRLIIAGSEDTSLRAWDARTGQKVWERPLAMKSAIRSLACTPKDAETDLLLVGLANGTPLIYNLALDECKPVVLPNHHKGAVTAVAFSPDGRMCATAGDDRTIGVFKLNDKGEWEQKQWLQEAHRAAITSLAFTQWNSATSDDWRLVSAGRDNVVIFWRADASNPLKKEGEFPHRSGDVLQVGANGDRVLFDAGKDLRVVSMSTGQIDGILNGTANAAAFSTMALFDPTGRIILTSVDGKAQLWRAPPRRESDGTIKDELARERGSELLHLASQVAATCGAFDPDGNFAVTGSQNGDVYFWEMSNIGKIEKRIPAKISLVDVYVDVTSQVRVWAELQGSKETLRSIQPGSIATIVVPPQDTQK